MWASGVSECGGGDVRAALLGCGAGEGVAALSELGLSELLGWRAVWVAGPRGERGLATGLGCWVGLGFCVSFLFYFLLSFSNSNTTPTI